MNHNEKAVEPDDGAKCATGQGQPSLGESVVVYEQSPNGQLIVKTDGETVWLTQEQMCQLFGRERSVITKHIRNVFNEGELIEDSVCANFAHTARDGKTYHVAMYNLDVVISVGYRVKSVQGTRFRQWATKMLREMLLRRCDEMRRIEKLEHRVDGIETNVEQIKGGMNYLVQQLAPAAEPPRRRIGFGGDSDVTRKPYGRK